MSDLEPTISSRKRISPLWIIPVVALVAGVWMVVQTWLSEGPTITIEFNTAEGLEEGKTKVKMLNVEVGLVEEVMLKSDASGVTATVYLEKEVAPLLRDDTRFWVVRARVGAGGITGLGTVLSGAYIELAPGEGKAGKRRYVGLEKPPLTPVGAPGKRLKLTSERASIRAGDPVLYQSFTVGRIESMTFDADRQIASYDVFVDAPYDSLVHESTRFWDTSGIELDASAEGVRLQVGSMQSLLLGGVAFDTPPGLPMGGVVENGTEFRLYSNYNDILKNPYRFGRYYVVSFGESMAGLVPGAPVTYRGIQIGRVERVLLKELTAAGLQGGGNDIPVLIYLEPGRLEVPDTQASVDALHESIKANLEIGLRATLQTGNLLTGRKVITFDYYPDAPAAELGTFSDYTTIPTINAGVGIIADQASELLKKFNNLPLETTVANANSVLADLNEGVNSLNQLLAAQSTQALPDELTATLDELRSVLDGVSQDAEVYQDLSSSLSSLDLTLQSINRLARELSDRPSSILFAPKPKEDAVPEAKP